MLFSNKHFSYVYSQLISDNRFVLGGCSMWYNWIAALADNNITQYGLESINLLQVNDLHSSNDHIRCTGAGQSQRIISSVGRASSGSSKSLSTTYCDGHSWVVNKCNSVVSICVDCSDPCSSTSSTKLLSPCSELLDVPGHQISVLATIFSRDVPGPHILDMSIIDVDVSRASISVSLDTAAYVRCASYPHTNDVDVTRDGIVRDGLMVAAVNAKAQIDLTNLYPSTDYVLYCFAQSSSVYQPSLLQTMTSQPFQTSCCRPIYLSLRYPLVINFDEIYISNFLKISAAGVLPDDVVTVSLIVLDSNKNPSTACVFSPPAVALRANASSTFTYSSGLSGCAVGNYSVKSDFGILSGPSAEAFQIGFDSPATFFVVEVVNFAPTMLTAAFSNDLSAVVVHFDTRIDTSTFSAIFDCASIFALQSGSRYFCRLNDMSSVFILMNYNSKLAIGDSVSLLTNTVRAPGSSVYALAQSVIITSATNPTNPVVVVSSPTLVSYCQDFELDMSSSSGSGGRSWQSISVSLSTKPVLDAVLISDLNNFLQSSSSISIFVSSSYLVPGYDYIFSVTMCNFAGVCGTNTHVTTISSRPFPMAILPGPAFETFYRSDSISYTAPTISNVTTCSLKSNIVYSWSVLISGEVEDVKIESAGSDPFKFILLPFTLNASSYYQLKLNIFDSSSLSSSSTIKSIYIYEGPIIAVILGGSEMSLSVGINHVFDGSQSYDDNIPYTRNRNAGLLYSWSCVQLYPQYSTSCPLSLSGSHSSSVSVNANSNLQLSKIELQLVVSDSTGSRSASASIVLNIVGSILPTLSISGTGSSSSPFAKSKLKLYGSVNWISSYDVKNLNASWSVSDPFVNLAAASLSPIEVSLGESVNASSGGGGENEYSSVTLNLVLLTSVFSVRDSYKFGLSLVGPAGVISTTSLIVVRNFPPSPGDFLVTPASGFEFSTMFTFSATYWNDLDLPLSYVFGYKSFGHQYGKNAIPNYIFQY